ncbi:MAG: sigma-54 dependent transcriptional regulator [Pirellulales bacterium]
MPKVLVIDDDRAILRLVEKALADTNCDVVTAANAADGMARMRDERPDAVLLDIILPDRSGIELVAGIREFDARLPVVFVTVSEDSDMAIEAMKLGAYDYVTKPLGIDQIRQLVERSLETRRLMQAPVLFEESDEELQDGDVLVGRSPQMLEVYKQIGRVAAQDVSVLIGGESGTGKELIARAIYQHSRRSDQCFLAVNCAALSDTLLETELFGHEKGAFTGAERRHIGKFEQCNDGTIFLDEVGDMSLLTQSKVLRLLQEQNFERVGGSDTIQVNVRIISATNRELGRMIEEGDFRLDLFHRLNAFEIHLPPLRERGDDITLLLEYFLGRFNRALNKKITGIAPNAIELLQSYDWPGNVRELQSVLRKAMLMATGPVLVPECFPREIVCDDRPARSVVTRTSSSTDLARFVDQQEAAGSEDLYAETLEWMERYLLTRILQQHEGNQSKAAAQLGITRGSLRHKIKTLNISINQVVSADDEEEENEKDCGC